MHLEIVSPEKKLYAGEVSLVQMPGNMGSFEVLHNHAPIVALLGKGRVKIIDSLRNTVFMTIAGGVVHVKDNHITIVTEK